MGITARKWEREDGQVVLKVPGCEHLITNDEALQLAAELKVAAQKFVSPKDGK